MKPRSRTLPVLASADLEHVSGGVGGAVLALSVAAASKGGPRKASAAPSPAKPTRPKRTYSGFDGYAVITDDSGGIMAVDSSYFDK
jgi:hypothetical protein